MRSWAAQRERRAFTMLEVLVATAIFILLGTALISMLTTGMSAWRSGERKRRTYERAQGALTQLSLDLEGVYSREPVMQGTPMARFFCVREGQGQRLSFIRTFGRGPERSLTYYANARGSKPYTTNFSGDPNQLQSFGGLMGVSYFRDERTLRRAIVAPPPPPSAKNLQGLITTAGGNGEVVADNVLFVGFRFWTQQTTSWVGPPPDPKKKGAAGPETIWDSTRGAGIGDREADGSRTRPFFMARGVESLSDQHDDVFPEIVEVTLVVEPDEKRAIRTTLTRPMTDSDGVAYVARTVGFDDPTVGSQYLLIGDEWVKIKAKEARAFRIESRGVRATPRVSHDINTEVRMGTTFVMRIHVPGYREDWSKDADFLRKAK